MLHAVVRWTLACAGLLVLTGSAGWLLWAATAWMSYGRPVRPERSSAILDRFVPAPEVAERHERLVFATPARAFEAATQFRLEDSGVVRAVFRAREWVFGLGHSSASPAPFLAVARSIGWMALDSIPGREIAFGAVCRPWQGEVRFQGLPPAQFRTFRDPDYARIAWAIGVDSLGPDRSRVWTETRVATTDAGARAKFRRYWAQFSPGIVLIRSELLRVVARRGERPRGR
jgi:hypothetical protein